MDCACFETCLLFPLNMLNEYDTYETPFYLFTSAISVHQFNVKSFEINTFPAVITGDLTLVIYINKKLQTTRLHVKIFEIYFLYISLSDECLHAQSMVQWFQMENEWGNALYFWIISKYDSQKCFDE